MSFIIWFAVCHIVITGSIVFIIPVQKPLASLPFIEKTPLVKYRSFDHSSDMDKNGLLFFLGTLDETSPWMNPAGMCYVY